MNTASDYFKFAPVASRTTYTVPSFKKPSLYVLYSSLLKVAWLDVEIESTDDGYFIASNPEIQTYGVGNTHQEATSDFLNMLVDLFQELTDSEDVLAPHLLKELTYLRGIVSQNALRK